MLLVIFPLILVVLGAFKNAREAADLALSLPSQWIFHNIIDLLTNLDFLGSMGNSLFYTGIGTFVCVMLNAIAAFVLARRTSSSINLLYYIFVAGLIIPPFVIPQILVMQKLHLMDTLLGTFAIYIANNIPFSIFLITGFIKGIPRALDEAAFVDGCKPLRTFFQIIFPLLMPVIVTLGVFVAINIWNDFQTPLYFIRNSDHYPITMWLYKSVSQHSTQWDHVFPNLLISMIPLVLVYSFAQKYIISGLTAGAVK
jgi:raffinose/stachyose/melibiose transport system permease protein